MNVSEEFVTKYKGGIREVLYSNYTRVSENRGRKLSGELSTLAFALYTSGYPLEEGENIKTTLKAAKDSFMASPEYDVFEFVALTYINSYYNMANLVRLQGIDNDHPANFGFNGAVDIFSNHLTMLNLPIAKRKNAEDSTLQRLQSVERKSLSTKAYMEETTEGGKYRYVEDINLVDKIFSIKVGTSQKSEYLEVCDKLVGGAMLACIDSIVDTYAELLAGTFGVDSYKGVITFDKDNTFVGLGSNACYGRLDAHDVLRDSYFPVIEEISRDVFTPASGINGLKYSTRQFDVDTIYKAYNVDKTKPVYFPHKVLEISSVTEVFTSTQSYAYKKCKRENSRSKDTYKAYLKKYFLDEIKDYVLICSKHFIDQTCPELDILDFEDDDCEYKDAYIADIRSRLDYYACCVTTVFIVAQLETTSEKSEITGKVNKNVLQFRFKICKPDVSVSNEAFCASLSERLYNRPDAIKGVSSSIPTSTKVVGMSKIDYAHCFDEARFNARPAFAYKALDALKEQGSTVDWTDILLGRFDDGSICKSGEGHKINLQDATTTWVFAGSRSGKGVMCYNLFSTALASRKPICYMDRKPDTAVVLRGLAKKYGGDMFVVNGGQRNWSSNDFCGAFDPIPVPKVSEFFSGTLAGDDAQYDLAYTRGLFLVYAIATFLDKYKADEEVNSHPAFVKIKKIIDDYGELLVVLDEFSNYMGAFGSLLSPKGLFGEKCLSDSGIKQVYGEITKDLADTAKAYNKEMTKAPDKQNQAVFDQLSQNASNAIQNVDVQQVKALLNGLYLRQFGTSMQDICKSIAEFKNADGNYVFRFKFFVIGQGFHDGMPEDSEFVEWSTGSGKKQWNVSQDKQGYNIIPILPGLVAGKQAFIMGYQPDRTGYLAQTLDGCVAKDWLTEARRGFAFHISNDTNKRALFNKISNTEGSEGTAKAKEWVNNDWVFFKPFLILNNAEEPDEYKYVDMEKFAIDESYRKDLFNTRKDLPKGKFVAQSIHVANLGGLTYDDVLADNDDGTGHFKEEIGFEGYCRSLGSDVLYETVKASGELMDIFVKEVLQYPAGWEAFVYDLTPEGLFDVVFCKNCLLHGRDYALREMFSLTFCSQGFMSSCFKIGDKSYSFVDVCGKYLGDITRLYPNASQMSAVSDEDNKNSVVSQSTSSSADGFYQTKNYSDMEDDDEDETTEEDEVITKDEEISQKSSMTAEDKSMMHDMVDELERQVSMQTKDEFIAEVSSVLYDILIGRPKLVERYKDMNFLAKNLATKLADIKVKKGELRP